MFARNTTMMRYGFIAVGVCVQLWCCAKDLSILLKQKCCIGGHMLQFYKQAMVQRFKTVVVIGGGAFSRPTVKSSNAGIASKLRNFDAVVKAEKEGTDS
uniref:Pyr_redox_2 domain-containing protein n=1 Tax=Syphacia muris TaxID=451379 RepID=A0A0N5A8D3_9BILA